jgi:uncharacterized short protein YbdD (DUF466 family)
VPPVTGVVTRLAAGWRGLVWWVRGVLGYARYLDHHRRSGQAGPPLTEREYWRARTDHQESHPEGRCC